MASEIPVSACRAWLLAAFAAVAMAAVGGPAEAGPGVLREGLFGGRRVDPPIARYVSQDGDGFVLDRSQPRPMLKFDSSPEVWALRPHPAPRGDIIYKNDLGEPVLRATRLGGLTVFTDARPGGSPAALAGSGPALRLQPLSPQALLQRVAQASARATRAARRLIPFEADATPESSALIADAAMVAAEAVVRLSRQPNGRGALTRFSKVELVAGRKPEATVRHGVMRITVAPVDGLAGRPSSDRIMAAAITR